MAVKPFIIFCGGGNESDMRGVDLMLIPGTAGNGETQIEGEMLSLVYDELRQVASRLMRRERSDHTLLTCRCKEVVKHAAFGDVNFAASDRSFLQAAAARAMREVLIDHARRRSADRRGGGWRRVPIDAVVEYFEAQSLDIVALHEALDKLAVVDQRLSQVITLRYFGGMTVPEVARPLGVSGGARRTWTRRLGSCMAPCGQLRDYTRVMNRRKVA